MTAEIEIVRIPVQPARKRELLEALTAARTSYLAPPGCMQVDLLATEVGDEVVAIVRWASALSHEQAARGPHAEAFFARLTTFAAGPPQVSKYVPSEGRSQ